MRFFTKKEARIDIFYCLREGYYGYYEDLHDLVFNSDYCVDSEEVALEMLQDYGIFEAIRKIQQYEKDRFGEVTTDLGNPKEVANMLYYIVEKRLYLGNLIQLLVRTGEIKQQMKLIKKC